MKIDILFLAKGRAEFTDAALSALVANTNPELVRSVNLWMDGDMDPWNRYTDGASPWNFTDQRMRGALKFAMHGSQHGGPVACMNYWLGDEYQPLKLSYWDEDSDGEEALVEFDNPEPPTEIFAKIDNDVIVPPGWLDAALQVMEDHPDLDFLGLEPFASRTANPGSGARGINIERFAMATGCKLPSFVSVDSIGGVGLFRRVAFNGRQPMNPHGFNGVGGWTGWQLDHPELRKGWIVPPLKLFLLDRLPFEPWLSLSKRYVAEGSQRPWTNYDPASAADLWGWWLNG